MCAIRYLKLLPFIILAVIFLSNSSASALVKSRSSEEILHGSYDQNRTRLESSNFGVPLVVESYERNDRVHVDVYGIFDYNFSNVAKSLTIPSSWCDIVPLHPNVKACTYRELHGAWYLTLYPGSKEYQPPAEKRRVRYNYRVIARQPKYLDVILNADAGPFGTKSHNMRFEAIPINDLRTFVHVSYSYSDSAALRLATRIYFATLGRDKVGFTVTGTDREGNPKYIGGPRGALERSAVRYYFAIQSFMDTLRYSEEKRFAMRAGEWFDQTARFKVQLFDLEKKDYLTSKASEHENQLKLQRIIDKIKP